MSFQEVTRTDPCPACGKPDWCAWVEGRAKLKCERTTAPPPGMVLLGPSDGGALFGWPGDGAHKNGIGRSVPKRAATMPTNATAKTNLGHDADQFRTAITAEQVAALARQLNVAEAALRSIGIGCASEDDLRKMRAGGEGWQDNYPKGAYTFPERDGSGRIGGLSLRAADGRKGFPADACRGLIVPDDLPSRRDPVLIVEGATDVAAAVTLGLAVLGRPSNSGGTEHLSRLLKGRRVLVLGERDQKPNGSWPGRDGAERVAARLASAWKQKVAWVLPPEGSKDLRAWLQSRIAAGLDTSDGEMCKAAGIELLTLLSAAADEAEPEKRLPQSEQLVRLAMERYRLGIGEGQEPFAVEREGPNVAMMFRGSQDALRSALARDYRRRYGTTPGGGALADALVALRGEAQECEDERVHLRLAEHDDGVVLDLADADGRAVIVDSSGWRIVNQSPVLFRRTALVAPMRAPERGASFDELRELLNVRDSDWQLIIGFMIAALIPGIDHPVMMLGGEQGAGKTTAGRYIVGMFDPSTAPVRSAPRSERQWAVMAAASWGMVLDNISDIPDWLSDAMCKASSGDAYLERTLYTNSEISVRPFKRVIILTSIDAGSLRGDLGDRLVLVDLQSIPENRRRPGSELDAMYAAIAPRVVGALLDLLAAVLRELPRVRLDRLPRMADFGRVLAAVDRVRGTRSLENYMAQGRRIASDVIEGDPVGDAVLSLVAEVGDWTGTAGDLLARITSGRPPKEWPQDARRLGGRLRRLTPAFRRRGIEVSPPPLEDKRRIYTIRRVAEDSTGDPTAVPPRQPPRGICTAVRDDARSVHELGGVGGMGGAFPATSGEPEIDL